MVGQVEEVADVVQGVVELGRARAAGAASRSASRRRPGLIAQDLPDQVDQRERITEADQPRGDLHVEDPARQPARS